MGLRVRKIVASGKSPPALTPTARAGIRGRAATRKRELRVDTGKCAAPSTQDGQFRVPPILGEEP